MASKRIWGWYFFDWASQPYSTLLLTFTFGPYFSEVASAKFLSSGMDQAAANAERCADQQEGGDAKQQLPVVLHLGQQPEARDHACARRSGRKQVVFRKASIICCSMKTEN